MKLKLKLERLQAIAPKVSQYGQRYNKISETRGRWKRICLYTLFVSSDNTFLFRDHVFQSKKKTRSAKEWSDWFAREVDALTGDADTVENGVVSRLRYIHEQSVLPGINIRTSKQWAVKQILGWTADAKHKAFSSQVAKARDSSKRRRSARG